MNRAEAKRRQAGEISNILALITILVIGRLTGENGVAYVIAAAEVSALLWSIVGGGLSDTLGKLLRSRKNKGQYHNTIQMRRIAMIFHGALGLLCGLLLFFCARSIAEGIFRVPYSALIIMVLSPILLLRSVTSVFLGYFQGEGSELPTAVSGILRQIFILGFGVVFSGILGGYGEKVGALLMQENYAAMYGGVGFAIAISLAEVLVLLFLLVIYKGMRSLDKKRKQDIMHSESSALDGIRSLWAGRWLQCVTEFLWFLPLALGMLFVSRAFGEEVPVSEYGVYAGDYLVICGMAVALISLTTLPVIARVFASLRKEEPRFARMHFQSGVHLCLVHGIFAALFVAIMGERFGELLCPENETAVRQMLTGGSAVIVFLALASYFGRFLRGVGKKMWVLGAVGIADGIFAISVMVTSGVGKAGILSLVYGGMVSLFVLCVMLGMLSYRQMRVRMDWLNALIVPMGAGSVSGLLCALLERAISPHMSSLVTLFVAFVVTGIVYWILLLLFRNFQEQELDGVIGGRVIYALGQMLHLY